MHAKLGLYAALLISLAAPSARADFEISLREGKTLFVRSWRIENDKIVASYGADTIEIDRARVVNIRDRSEDPTTRAPSSAQAAAPAPRIEARQPMSMAEEGAKAREGALTRELILAHRDVLFAQNRGESEEAIAKREADIAKLEAERATLRAKFATH